MGEKIPISWSFLKECINHIPKVCTKCGKETKNKRRKYCEICGSNLCYIV